MAFNATDDSHANSFEGKLNSFITSTDSVLSNNKLPGWIKAFLESIRVFAKDVSDTFNVLEGRLSVQKAVTDGLSLERANLQEKLTVVENELNEQLQYSRRNMILIHGIDEPNGRENTDDVAIEVFKKIDVDVKKNQINRSHRLGPRKMIPGKEHKRPIIVSFCSYREKKAVFDAKKKLKGSKTVITESLTKSRYALLQQCYETYGKNNCWSYDGKIWVFQENEKFIVNHVEDLAESRGL